MNRMSKHNRRSLVILILLGLVLAVLMAMATITIAANGNRKGHHKDVQPAPVAPQTVPVQPQHPAAPPSAKQPKSGASLTMDAQAAAPQAAAALAVVADHLNDPRDMKILLIAADGTETSYAAQRAFLDQLGVPYDTMLAVSTTLTSNMLWDGVNHGKYQGIILTSGSLVYYDAASNSYPNAFTLDEWNILWDYEARFGVRQVTSATNPNFQQDPFNYGLNWVADQNTSTSPLQATLTTAGQQVYPYLNASNPVSITNAYVYLSTVISPAETTPLLVTANGYAIASIHTFPDGRQNLAVTAENSPFLYTRHSLLLSYGTINWLTKGQFLGERHVYMSPQPDDVFIDDDLWDTTALTDTTGLNYRITGNDFTKLVAWQNLVRAGYVAPTCVTVQPNANAGKDAYIMAGSTPSNFGNAKTLRTNSQQAGLVRSLVQFTLPSIPSNATVLSATVSLYLTTTTGLQTDVVEAHRLTRTWTEGNGNDNSGATWARYDGVSNWTTAGGDYDPSIAGSFVASGTGWKTITVTALAQGWISGTYANQGVILLSAPQKGNNLKQYASSDASNANASQRPRLDLCYRPAGTNNTAAFMLEMPFNGEGASGIYTDTTLTQSVMLNQGAFRWLNHTYTHINLDAPTTGAQVQSELQLNDAVAVNQFHFTNYFKDAMVQPDISGFTNTAALQAIYNFGIRYFIDDTSRPGWNNPSANAGFINGVPPSPNACAYQPNQPACVIPQGSNPPPLVVVPRHPTNLFYNLSTPAEFVSEYNCYYSKSTGTCANRAFVFWDRDLTYTEILDKESDMMLQYLLKWDSDPLMFHQPNLRAYDGTHSLLGDLVDATLAKYNKMVKLPILSMAHHDLGIRTANRMAYNASGVTAALTPCTSLTLTATKAALVPLTGVAAGTNQEVYGGQIISYVQLAPNTPVTVPVTCP